VRPDDRILYEDCFCWKRDDGPSSEVNDAEDQPSFSGDAVLDCIPVSGAEHGCE
jgi:hypothetical protein